MAAGNQHVASIGSRRALCTYQWTGAWLGGSLISDKFSQVSIMPGCPRACASAFMIFMGALIKLG